MIKVARYIFSICAAALLLFSFTCCRRIPLHDPGSNVFLKINIELRSNVELNEDLNIEGDAYLMEKVYGKKPEMMRACFYDIESHELVYEFYLPPEGDFIDILPGEYDLIVYSLGNEATRVESTEKRGTGRAFTNRTGESVNGTVSDATSGTKATGSQAVIFEPDHLYAGRLEKVKVPVMEDDDPTFIIDIPVSTILDTYSFEIINIVGAGRIQKADIYITGQAPSKYLWDLRYPSIPASIYFQASVNYSKEHIYTIFNTFGKFPGETNLCYINVLLTDGRGEKFLWVFDVTEQFDNPDNTRHEIIIDERIEIPEKGNAGGFNIGVQGYQTVIIPVVIG